MITLRKINKADSSSIFDLVMELAVFEKSASAVKTCPEDFESNYEKGIFDGFVAEVTGQGIVGMALFSYFPPGMGLRSIWRTFTLKKTIEEKKLAKCCSKKFLTMPRLMTQKW